MRARAPRSPANLPPLGIEPLRAAKPTDTHLVGASTCAAMSVGTSSLTSRLHNLKSVADVLDVSVAHLRREIRLKRLAIHRIGRLVRIAEADLADYLARHRR